MSDVAGQEKLDALAGDTEYLDRDDYSDNGTDTFFEDVVFTIQCLTELGPSLEQNLVSARRLDSSSSKSAFDLLCPSGPGEFYVSLVRDKFKGASKALVERLGGANWQRHLKVREMMEEPANSPAKGQKTTHSVFGPDTTFNDSGVGTSVPARTPYPFRMNNTERGPSSLRVPHIPLEATDFKPFLCYLCGNMLSTISTRNQWK